MRSKRSSTVWNDPLTGKKDKRLDMQHALERLCTKNGPSGFEAPVAEAAKALLEPLMDEVWTDRIGNVVGVRRCGRPRAKKLLLDAHLDEIGLIVTGIEEGFLRFQSIGGVDTRMLPGRELTVLTDPPILGVVATMPPHACAQKDKDRALPLSELYVDIGMDQPTAEQTVPIGTPMVFRAGCFPLGSREICGKSMDDRSCFVTLLRAVEFLQEKDLDVDLYILGSTREEISGSGAQCAAFAIEPDYCVAVDVTHGRTPDGPKDKSFALGGGPVVGVGPNMTRWMTDLAIRTANEVAIPIQLEVMAGHSGTNGWYLQICREGVPTLVLSLPLKYMHSPIEVLDRQDMEQVAQLLAAIAERLGRENDRL